MKPGNLLGLSSPRKVPIPADAAHLTDESNLENVSLCLWAGSFILSRKDQNR
ncbi:hypothetical protein KKC1_15790 [Calderihabitans maritimus]|uniref:Uncharacterized protein n=1 Tax=Calderihabitans maritimus TaxID=1246530 RepID=A0A1Z5HSZ2_9FIRM|nr:hypothetical protein KKC1_15790 [Calderihabitans maritimus]